MRIAAGLTLGLLAFSCPSLASADPPDAAVDAAFSGAADAAVAPDAPGGPDGSMPAWGQGSLQGGQSFTPESFLMPVDSIILSNIDPNGGSGWQGGGSLYQCPSAAVNGPTPAGSADAGPAEAGAMTAPDGGTDGCYVDMADNSALAALFSQPANVPPGSYNAIVVNNCEHQGSFVAKLKGTVNLAGTTYYTTAGRADQPILSTSRSDYDYVSITYSGCSGPLRLAQPVSVQAGDAITVSAFFTLSDLAWVLPDNTALGGCVAGRPYHTQNVCSGLPALVAYVGASAPALETFLITEDQTDTSASKAGGEVLLLSQGGMPFSGFLRRWYSPTAVVPSISYDVPLRSVAANGSSDAGVSTYTLTAYGDPAEDPTKFRAKWPAFEMATHQGTMLSADGSHSVSYRAVLR
jgi:hypothetical protein